MAAMKQSLDITASNLLNKTWNAVLCEKLVKHIQDRVTLENRMVQIINSQQEKTGSGLSSFLLRLTEVALLGAGAYLLFTTDRFLELVGLREPWYRRLARRIRGWLPDQ